MFLENPIYNLDYVKKDIIDHKIPGSGTPENYYPPKLWFEFYKNFIQKIIKLIEIKR